MKGEGTGEGRENHQTMSNSCKKRAGRRLGARAFRALICSQVLAWADGASLSKAACLRGLTLGRKGLTPGPLRAQALTGSSPVETQTQHERQRGPEAVSAGDCQSPVLLQTGDLSGVGLRASTPLGDLQLESENPGVWVSGIVFSHP